MSDLRSAQADALMGELQRQGAGRLTIFLGAAPGVGKTYAMLGRARELQRRGSDVAVVIRLAAAVNSVRVRSPISGKPFPAERAPPER